MNGAFIMRRNGWRGWAAWMLLPALLFIALLPRGYMPDVEALRRGNLSLTLCRVVEPRGGEADRPSTFDHLAACPFGMLPVMAAPPEPQLPPLSLGWALVAVSWGGQAAIFIQSRIAGLGARGPPGASALAPTA